MDALVADVCNKLQLSVEMLNVDLAHSEERKDYIALYESEKEDAKNRVKEATKIVKTEASKVGFLFSQSSIPDAAAAKALIEGLCSSGTLLCTVFATIAARGGKTLRKGLYNAAKSVIDGASGLIQHANTMISLSESPSSENRDRAVRLAATCISQCELASKIPINDKLAIGRALSMIRRQIADAASEITEEMDSTEEISESEKGICMCKIHAKDNRSEDDQRDLSILLANLVDDRKENEIAVIGFFNHPEKEMSEGIQVCAAGRNVLADTSLIQTLESNGLSLDKSSLQSVLPSYVIMMAVSRIIISVEALIRIGIQRILSLDNDNILVDAWESVLDHSRDLSIAVDDLAALSYEDSPDIESLVSSTTSLEQSCFSIADISDDQEVKSATHTITKAVLPLNQLLALIAQIS